MLFGPAQQLLEEGSSPSLRFDELNAGSSELRLRRPGIQGWAPREGNGIAVRKDDPQTLSKVNAALEAIRADGTYDRITAKYFPFKLM